MILKRLTAREVDGVFQASAVLNKPPNSPLLRRNSYFITVEVCEFIIQSYENALDVDSKGRINIFQDLLR